MPRKCRICQEIPPTHYRGVCSKRTQPKKPKRSIRCNRCFPIYAKLRAMFFARHICPTDSTQAVSVSGLQFFTNGYNKIKGYHKIFTENNGCTKCSSHCQDCGCDHQPCCVFYGFKICHTCLKFYCKQTNYQCCLCLHTRHDGEFYGEPEECAEQDKICMRCVFFITKKEQKYEFAEKLTPLTFKNLSYGPKNLDSGSFHESHSVPIYYPGSIPAFDAHQFYNFYELAFGAFVRIVNKIGQKTFYREIYWEILNFALEDFLELMEIFYWKKNGTKAKK